MSDDGQSPHLPTEMVSAYVDGALSETEVAAVEDHLNECAACRADLAEVVGVVRRRRRRRSIAVAVPMVGAAAAAVLLMVVIPDGRPAQRDQLRSEPPVVATLPAIETLAPADAATVGFDSLVFRWRRADPAPGAVLYRVTLTDQRGEVVWTSETRDSAIVLPSSVRLLPNASYLWYVDGLLPGARSASSGIHGFRTPP